MGCISKLASFPNSRIRTRRPTQTAVTYALAIETANLGTGILETQNDTITSANRNQLTTNDNTIVAEPDPLATYLTLRNIDPAEPLYYTYVSPGQEDTIDVVAEGMLLRAGDAIDLEVTDSIVIAKGAHSDGVTAINARVDKGIG